MPMNTSRSQKWVLAANAALVATSAIASLVGVVDPTLVLPDGSTAQDGLRLYAEGIAVRQLPLTAAVFVSLGGRHRRHLVPLLAVSAAAQAGDMVMGLTSGVPGMAIGGGVSAVVHLASAVWLGRRQASASLTTAACPAPAAR